MLKGIFLGNRLIIDRVYTKDIQNKMRQYINLRQDPVKYDELESNKEYLKDVHFIFSTWGMPGLSEDEIKGYFPALKAVFYGAGSVQGFARPFLNLGIKVISGWGANGVPVAEFTTAQIILANKGVFQTFNISRNGEVKKASAFANSFPGNYNTKVGIIGAGMIGTLVIKLLKSYNIEVLVYDPFLSDERARELGVEKCGLERIFSECQTISNHLANNKQTENMLDYNLFSRMKDNATFINTGRAAQVVQEDLIKALKEKGSRTALLDLVDYFSDSFNELVKMPNVFITPHIAGSMGDEVARMGEYMLSELENYIDGRQLKYEVKPEMLDTMA